MAIASSKRMGRDSNPRWTLAHSGFQDRRLRPLGHPSKYLSNNCCRHSSRTCHDQFDTCFDTRSALPNSGDAQNGSVVGSTLEKERHHDFPVYLQTRRPQAGGKAPQRLPALLPHRRPMVQQGQGEVPLVRQGGRRSRRQERRRFGKTFGRERGRQCERTRGVGGEQKCGRGSDAGACRQTKDSRRFDVSSYTATVRETGLEPARPCGH